MEGVPLAARSPRFLLIQARFEDDPACAHERRCFALRLQVPLACIEPLNIFTDDVRLASAEGTDAVLVGGSGDFSVLDADAHVRRCIDGLAALAEAGPPMFASCFGFQALVVGLGGEVITDRDNAEIGTLPVALTGAGASDPLFGALPQTFAVQLGHHDRATRLPGGVESLAASERVPFQAFRLPDRPVYATQFHPEMTGEDTSWRFQRYLERYAGALSPQEIERALAGHVPSPEANTLLRRFHEKYVQGRFVTGGSV